MSDNTSKTAETNKGTEQPATAKPGAKDPYNLAQVQGVTYLSYLGILLLVPLLMHQDNKFVKFHANQGLVLALAAIIINFALGVTIILALLMPLVWVGVIVFVVMGMVNVSKGEMKPLPLIGKLEIIK